MPSISINELRKLCTDPQKTEGRIVRFGRQFSIYFTRIFISLSIKPDTVSLLWILLGLTAALLLFFDSLIITIISGVLLYIHFTWDLCDGELARYYGTTSSFGKFLDYVGHMIVHSSLILALGIRETIFSGSIDRLLLGLITALLYGILYNIKISTYAADLSIEFFQDYKNKKLHKLVNDHLNHFIW